MRTVPRFRHLVGYPNDRIGEQANDVDALQDMFGASIPNVVLDFLATLSDCVLYYRFDAVTKTGRTKDGVRRSLESRDPMCDRGASRVGPRTA